MCRVPKRIARAAATLFSERGYEAVSVLDVAAAADVSEQTVYNHFPTKEDPVFDRTATLDRALAEAVLSRTAGTPAATGRKPRISRSSRGSVVGARGAKDAGGED